MDMRPAARARVGLGVAGLAQLTSIGLAGLARLGRPTAPGAGHETCPPLRTASPAHRAGRRAARHAPPCWRSSTTMRAGRTYSGRRAPSCSRSSAAARRTARHAPPCWRSSITTRGRETCPPASHSAPALELDTLASRRSTTAPGVGRETCSAVLGRGGPGHVPRIGRRPASRRSSSITETGVGPGDMLVLAQRDHHVGGPRNMSTSSARASAVGLCSGNSAAASSPVSRSSTTGLRAARHVHRLAQLAPQLDHRR